MPTTRLSDKGFVERMASDALRVGQPMDAGFVWKLVDNIQHMVDESGCYRVNWMGQIPGLNENHYALVHPTWHTWFPTQIVDDAQYCRYDIRVAVYDGLVRPVTISLVTPTTQAPVEGVGDGVIGTFTGSTSIGAHMFQMRFASCPIARAPLHVVTAPTTSAAAVGKQALLKLLVEIPIAYDDDDEELGSPAIIGCQVREYLR